MDGIEETQNRNTWINWSWSYQLQPAIGGGSPISILARRGYLTVLFPPTPTIFVFFGLPWLIFDDTTHQEAGFSVFAIIVRWKSKDRQNESVRCFWSGLVTAFQVEKNIKSSPTFLYIYIYILFSHLISFGQTQLHTSWLVPIDLNWEMAAPILDQQRPLDSLEMGLLMVARIWPTYHANLHVLMWCVRIRNSNACLAFYI